MLTVDELNARAEALGQDALLQQLAGRVRSRVARLFREDPPIPARKALLSRSGAVCPHDGGSLVFDPWQPSQHRCPRCARVVTGDRHDGHWARAGHLWVAERIADLATLAALEGDEDAAARARELIIRTAAVYGELPNRDNVLGPTHLFFSTYLESIWITSWIAGAFLLRQTDRMDDETAAAVDAVAEEAATIIGEFNEGLSNRQTWNSAALTAIGAWFGDEELAQNAIESRTGLLGHLTDGFEGDDAAWWEGENYHLFAARGLTIGMSWARLLGFDLLSDDELRLHFRRAMLAPSLTALPDLTYPARKDARYGVSLAEPAHLETWEAARAWLEGDQQMDAWLGALYATTPRPAEPYDAWLHDAGFALPSSRGRGDLSWWSLLTLDPREVDTSAPLEQHSLLLASQGLGILRHGDRYASLECGASGGGHGHPDRLHLTLHARGVHWLPDPGTGSYVDPSLFWYRSARAHNAPTVDGASPGEARCAAFEASDGWGWIRGSAGAVTRSIVAGPDLIVELLEMSPDSGAIELPWHLQGKLTVATPGTWEPAEIEDPSLEAQRFVAAAAGPLVIESEENGHAIRLHLFGGGELVRAMGPGLPGSTSRQQFYLRRIRDSTWLGTVIDLDAPSTGVVEWSANGASVTRASGRVEVTITPTRASVSHPGGKVTLTGLRDIRPAPRPLIAERPAWEAHAMVPHAWTAPALDASFEGFDLGHPLTLDDEHQYRRSEEPYDEQRFSATAWLNWDRDGIYLAVEVRKPELVLRAADAPPLDLDNEVEDIHQDGLQIYLRYPDETAAGFVVALDETGSLRGRSVGPEAGTSVEGAWAESDEGYVLTLALRDARFATLQPGDLLKFDLVVNEMTSERVRRLGQLVWSGDGGWTYLRGDRGAALGIIELG